MRDAFFKAPLFWIAALVLAAIFVFAGTAGPGAFAAAKDPARLLSGKSRPVTLGGVVASAIDERESAYGVRRVSFVLDARRVWLSAEESRNVRGRVRVLWSGPVVVPRYGDEIVVEGELAAARGVRNPGGFDERLYLAGRNIHSVFFAGRHSRAKCLRGGQGNPVTAFMLKARRTFLGRLSDGFTGENAAFLKALYFGDRSGLGDDLKDLFLKTGTLHILAVSGFNIGFLAALIFGLMRPFRLPKNARLGIVLVSIWAYCLIVGWQAPVLRASIMASVYLIGEMIGRKGNLLNSLGLAALIILAFYPMQAFDAGFQLSFSAVWAMSAILPRFYRPPGLLPNEKRTFAENAAHYFKELFWISFVCTLATLPITVQTFYRVSPVSPLANLAVVPLSFLIFVSGAIFLALALVLPQAGAFLVWPVKTLIDIMLALLRVFEGIPGATVIVGRLWPFFLAVLIVGLAVFLFRPRGIGPARRALLITAFTVLVLSAQDLARWYRPGVYAVFLDVGQGDAAYFEFPNGTNLLIDAGVPGKGRQVIVPFLSSRGVRSLDTVVATHPQADHIGGLPEVLEALDVRRYAGAGDAYTSQLFQSLGLFVRREHCDIMLPKKGTQLDLGPRIEAFVLNPDAQHQPSKNVNNDSVVLSIRAYGRRFLMTGDIEEPVMERMLDEGLDLRADVLKVPHHGAKLREGGQAFVRRVDPRYSVISVGARNLFGHPKPETLAVLKAIPNNRLLRTDESGAVRFAVDDRGLHLVGSSSAN